MPDADALKQRTKTLALRVMKLADALPATACGRVIGNQVLRSATSVGANYRAACRARSHKEFISKLGIAEEEADETLYWLELIAEGDLLPHSRVLDLLDEAGQVTAILVASRKTAKQRSMVNRQS